MKSADIAQCTVLTGHGTRNDFVLILGPDATTAPASLSAAQVAALCSHEAGLGVDGGAADGLIRCVPPGSQGHDSLWFMDYRNADGSLAQMCGNGARVFVRAILQAGFASGDATGRLRIATRAGEHAVTVNADQTITVDMGAAELPSMAAPPQVSVPDGAGPWPATAVLMPNPHAVVFVESLDQAGALTTAPTVQPDSAFPNGVNTEFVAITGVDRLAMRVFERGVGETASCGTGACAAVVAARLHAGTESPASWSVTVPGGELIVRQRADGIDLTGPAVITSEVPQASVAQILAAVTA